MNYWELCRHGLPEINCAYCTHTKTREAVIEECARVVDGYLLPQKFGKHEYDAAKSIAAAIRALKEKP